MNQIREQSIARIVAPRKLRTSRLDPLGRLGLYRVARMGRRRQILFLPYFVLKAAAGDQVDHLKREVDNAHAASQSRFWSALVARPRRIGRRAAVMRRYAALIPEDYGAISSSVEDRFDVALGYAHQPALTLIDRNPIVAALPDGGRERVRAALTGVTLPRTSMHGDMHMFNFCRAKDGFVLIDWEDYAARGSYVLDYVDFHVHNRFFAQEAMWFTFFLRLEGPDPFTVLAAERLGIAPRTLWLLYVLVKLENMARQFGGLDAMHAVDRKALLDFAAAQVAAAPVARPACADGVRRRSLRAYSDGTALAR